MKYQRGEALREETIQMAPEDSVRRLARYCGVANWDTLPVVILIDELAWKGVVYSKYGSMYG